MNRVLLVTHTYPEPTYELSQIQGFVGDDGSVERFEIDDSWTLPALADFDAVVMFVRFRELIERPEIPWGNYSGLKVLLDQDAFMEFCGWHGQSPYAGKWSWALRHFGFDALICTGLRTEAYFTDRGFTAVALPKAYDEANFFPLGGARSGTCHYGNEYGARLAMLRRLRKAGLSVDHIRVPYDELNAALNRYESVVICNMTSTYPLGRLGAHIERRWPGSILRTEPAPEPMIKNFEAMASGCCVFMDFAPDLEGLGFQDGHNCVVYDSFEDLLAKLDAYGSAPSATRAIGVRGAHLVRERHTWHHRGQEFRTILANLM